MAIIVLNNVVFTSGSDVVDGSILTPPEGLYVGASSSGIPVAGVGSAVETGDGNDRLYGKMDDSSTRYPGPAFNTDINVGVVLFNILDLGNGNDDLIGEGVTDSGQYVAYGIDLELSGEIKAGAGNDKVQGLARSDLAYSDYVAGIRVGGAADKGIDMGIGGPGAPNKGNDTVTGVASGKANYAMYGIGLLAANSFIKTNEGNDTVTGITDAIDNPPSLGLAGIELALTAKIEMGSGNDKVIARATLNGTIVNGFGGTGTVDLGTDNDTLEGFGGIRAKGGSGQDTWNLSAYNKSDFAIVKSLTDTATFTKGGITATIDGFESFLFADGAFSYAGL